MSNVSYLIDQGSDRFRHHSHAAATLTSLIGLHLTSEETTSATTATTATTRTTTYKKKPLPLPCCYNQSQPITSYSSILLNMSPDSLIVPNTSNRIPSKLFTIVQHMINSITTADQHFKNNSRTVKSNSIPIDTHKVWNRDVRLGRMSDPTLLCSYYHTAPKQKHIDTNPVSSFLDQCSNHGTSPPNSLSSASSSSSTYFDTTFCLGSENDEDSFYDLFDDR